MDFTLASTIRLNNGIEMPRFGLGTARMTDVAVVSNAVRTAIQAGYRLIDTSKNYENEVPVGLGIRESGVPEDRLFITTKLEKEDYGYAKAKRGFEGSIGRLGLQKVDLYLIHAPEDDPQARIEAWRSLTEMVDGRRLRAAGVSNYEIEHFEEIERAGLPVPAVNQIEVSPETYSKQKRLIEYCQRHAIVLTAYSPLGVGNLLRHPLIRRMADRYRKTPSQVILRWCLQHDLTVIPKSAREEHIRENMDIFDFEITDEDMALIDTV